MQILWDVKEPAHCSHGGRDCYGPAVIGVMLNIVVTLPIIGKSNKIKIEVLTLVRYLLMLNISKINIKQLTNRDVSRLQLSLL